MNGEGKTCGDCGWWLLQPREPDESRAIDLSAPQFGLCRLELRSVTVPTPKGLGHHSWYPPVEESNPACSHFQARSGDGR
jgi:hypothetical protein